MGMAAGAALLVLPALSMAGPLGEVPGKVANWIVGPPPPRGQLAQPPPPTRPLRGALPAQATPTPLPVPPVPGVASPESTTNTADLTCGPAGDPTAASAFLVLQRALGEVFGRPTECPHVDQATGDLQQRTTTGLAYLVAGSDVLAFTDGEQHWALTPVGLVVWRGPDPLPRADAVRVGDRAGGVRVEGAQGALEPGARLEVRGTDGTGLVLRASPRMDDWTPRGFLEHARVTVEETAGPEWVRVRGDNGLEGWVPTRYLAPVS